MSPASVSDVIDLYERWGSKRYDEDLSQRDHALQTAALAVEAGASDALCASALLHDIGHLLEIAANDGGGTVATMDLGHEATGARYLATLFPPQVTGPIALHVRAKRYRCAVDSTYHDGLSDGSRRSLQLQGGPMDPAEITAFEAHPGFGGAVLLRAWDDLGKVDGLDVTPLQEYRDLLERSALPPPIWVGAGRSAACDDPHS